MEKPLVLAVVLGAIAAALTPVRAEASDRDIVIAYDLGFFSADERPSIRSAAVPPRMGASRSIPAPASACQSGPNVAIFDVDQAAITTRVQAVLEETVSTFGRCGSARIMLAGHAAGTGTSPQTVALAQRRAAAVTAYLTIRGVPESAIANANRSQGERMIEISYDSATVR
ncbi:MAG: OmpA family protein [Erythrobacter sp.]